MSDQIKKQIEVDWENYCQEADHLEDAKNVDIEGNFPTFKYGFMAGLDYTRRLLRDDSIKLRKDYIKMEVAKDAEIAKLTGQAQQLSAQVQQLRAALEWYAGDESGKEKSMWADGIFVTIDKFGRAFSDNGNLAKRALSQEGKRVSDEN